MKHRYEVHTWTLCQGWINCWTEYEEPIKKEGIIQFVRTKPVTFSIKDEAQAELDEFFADIEDQIKSGERDPEDGYDPEEFRIYDNLREEYVS